MIYLHVMNQRLVGALRAHVGREEPDGSVVAWIRARLACIPRHGDRRARLEVPTDDWRVGGRPPRSFPGYAPAPARIQADRPFGRRCRNRLRAYPCEEAGGTPARIAVDSRRLRRQSTVSRGRWIRAGFAVYYLLDDILSGRRRMAIQAILFDADGVIQRQSGLRRKA